MEGPNRDSGEADVRAPAASYPRLTGAGCESLDEPRLASYHETQVRSSELTLDFMQSG
jgi:hypothetical protein